MLDLSGGKPVTGLSWHPTASSILAASSACDVAIFDTAASTAAHRVKLTKEIWSINWSTDGKVLSAAAKDGILRTYDMRASSDPTQEGQVHHGIKPIRHAWISNEQLLTTGVSRMREREYALWDCRNLSREVKRQRIDSNTGVLIPLVDVERNIVYLAGRVRCPSF